RVAIAGGLTHRLPSLPVCPYPSSLPHLLSRCVPAAVLPGNCLSEPARSRPSICCHSCSISRGPLRKSCTSTRVGLKPDSRLCNFYAMALSQVCRGTVAPLATGLGDTRRRVALLLLLKVNRATTHGEVRATTGGCCGPRVGRHTLAPGKPITEVS